MKEQQVRQLQLEIWIKDPNTKESKVSQGPFTVLTVCRVSAKPSLDRFNSPTHLFTSTLDHIHLHLESF